MTDHTAPAPISAVLNPARDLLARTRKSILQMKFIDHRTLFEHGICRTLIYAADSGENRADVDIPPALRNTTYLESKVLLLRDMGYTVGVWSHLHGMTISWEQGPVAPDDRGHSEE